MCRCLSNHGVITHTFAFLVLIPIIIVLTIVTVIGCLSMLVGKPVYE